MRVSSSSGNRKEPESVSIPINAGSNCLVDVFFFIKKEMKLYNISQVDPKEVSEYVYAA
jgi:hypothetical protein